MELINLDFQDGNFTLNYTEGIYQINLQDKESDNYFPEDRPFVNLTREHLLCLVNRLTQVLEKENDKAL